MRESADHDYLHHVRRGAARASLELPPIQSTRSQSNEHNVSTRDHQHHVAQIPRKPKQKRSRYLVGGVELPHEEPVGGVAPRLRGARAEELVGGVERDEDHRGGAGDLDLPAGREEEPERRHRRGRPRGLRRHAARARAGEEGVRAAP
jgi:hypothetical protein